MRNKHRNNNNTTKQQKTKTKSTKIGLENLDERFKIIVGNGILKEVDAREFKLGLPMLELTN